LLSRSGGHIRRCGKTIALAALASGVALVLFVWLGVMPALERQALEAELAAQEAAAQAEWEEREAEAKREAWKTLGDPTVVLRSASDLLEIVKEEEEEDWSRAGDPTIGVEGPSRRMLEMIQEEEAKRQAESVDEPLKGSQ
jgi:flagellar biosynthesis/type III secretory pathway M-ring protein FliF/YscJ